MAIFPYIETDDIVQVDDKFRISGIKSYVSKDEAAITKVEVEPEAAAGYIDITGTTPKQSNYYLDWQYSTDGDKVISLRVTTDGAPITVTKTVSALLLADDHLFAGDQDLITIEHDILKYVPAGRNSFKYLHRESQKQIMEWLYINDYRATDGSRLLKEDLINIEEVNYWSKFAALRLLFNDLSNALGDIFEQKARKYENDEHKWRHNAAFKIDVNQDGVQGENEGFYLTSRNIVRT